MKIYGLLTMIISLAVLTTCSTNKNTYTNNTLLFEKDALIKIKQVTYQKQIAGREEAGDAYKLQVEILSNPKNSELDSIYFRGLKGKLKLQNTSYSAILNGPSNKELIMSENQIEELENELPDISKLPFNLNDSECVISYIENSRTKFLKITKLKELPATYYPSTPPKK